MLQVVQLQSQLILGIRGGAQAIKGKVYELFFLIGVGGSFCGTAGISEAAKEVGSTFFWANPESCLKVVKMVFVCCTQVGTLIFNYR